MWSFNLTTLGTRNKSMDQLRFTTSRKLNILVGAIEASTRTHNPRRQRQQSCPVRNAAHGGLFNLRASLSALMTVLVLSLISSSTLVAAQSKVITKLSQVGIALPNEFPVNSITEKIAAEIEYEASKHASVKKETNPDEEKPNRIRHSHAFRYGHRYGGPQHNTHFHNRLFHGREQIPRDHSASLLAGSQVGSAALSKTTDVNRWKVLEQIENERLLSTSDGAKHKFPKLATCVSVSVLTGIIIFIIIYFGG